MNTKTFKRAVDRKERYSRYYHYLLSLAVLCFGAGLLSGSIAPGGMVLGGLFSVLGLLSLFWLVPHRYKAMHVPSVITIEAKQAFVPVLAERLKASSVQRTAAYYLLNYRIGSSSAYSLYLGFDAESFVFCLIPSTGSRGGFIDLGRTEKHRKNIVSMIGQAA